MSLKRLFKKVVGVAAPIVGGIFGGPAGAAIGSAVGGAVSGGSSAKPTTQGGQPSTFDKWAPILAQGASAIYSGRQAKKLRDWQASQANSAHQREVADLRLAGLNPILSGTGGSGAATTSGAMGETPDFLQAVMAKKQLQNLEATTNNIDADTRIKNFKYTQDVKYNDMERQTAIWSGREAAQNVELTGKNLQQQLTNLQEQLRGNKISNDEAKILLDNLEDNKELATWLQSADYAQRKELNAILEGDASAGEIIKALLALIR